ncbi:MAG: hypothetical protein OQK32_03465 [Gammaproteobacteria bacterium]|nr:hypothetical protein [Gammaproteobacteria bacterium]MCW8924512.1 hypothetical protein [Gammaproteobacteria bacterium]
MPLLRIRTPFVVEGNKKVPQFFIDFPNKITSMDAYSANDEGLYVVEADQTTLDAISSSPDYEVIEP